MALCRCFVVSIYLFMLVSPRRYSVQGISPDVFTRPKDLGFEVYSKSIPSKVFHLIQPKAEGAILAHIGPYNFTYFYRMASISVFLNTHLIFSHKAYTSPLYALCSVERSNIIAQPNAVLVCEFSVYISSFEKHVFSNSSCVIHSMNETECATQLDLDFLRLQFSSTTSQVSILVRYNVTAYQLNKTTAEFHPSDITNLLIHNSYVLPPVTVISQPDFRWLTLIKDTEDVSVIQVGIPSLRTNNAIPILLAVSPQSPIQGFKLKLLLSSTLRYHFENEKRTEEARAWKVSVASKRYGAIVRARRIKPVGTGSRNQSLGSNDLESSRIIISELLLEHIAKSDSESTTSPWDEAFKRADSTQLDYSESPLEQGTEDDSAESEESGGQPMIHVQLIQLVPPNISVVRRSQSFPTLTLMAPQLVPQPGAMHIFVQFEPKDVVEPPWYPAAPSPEPLKLRVIGLIPYPKIKFSARKSGDALFAQSSAGTLTDITHHVLCRPASLRSTGERAFDGSSPSGPTCLSTMRQAPSELEEFSSFQNGPLHGLQPSMLTQAAGGLGARFGWSDQIVLAIGALSGLPSPIVPSIYGPVYGPKEKAGWQWRDWRGPTVRRWMLEGFRIHVTRKHLRRINAWQVPDSGFRDKRPSNESTGFTERYEQAQITVTSRIYTMRPGTGQRIYLGETYTPHTSGSYGSTDYDSDSASKDGEYLEITEFDVTHLLPVWALIVRTVNEPHSGETSNRVPAAYIHYDAFTGRPHLVGRWPGRVMLGLVATLDDSQPLASTYVDIGRRGQNESRGGTMTEDTISVAAIRAECVNQNLILSGQLDPASPTTGVFDSSFRGSGSLSFQGVTDLRSATDYSLPTPHRLSIDLNVAGSGGDSLVTAAASSAVRSPEALRSIFSQKWTNPTKPIGSSSSSATCPVQLLAVSLVMSDNSVLPAHQVPPNYLRISSLDSDLVWDPAIPTQPAIGYAKNSVETSSASVYVRVNSLVVWTSYSQSKQETGFHRSVPLGAMDDVVLAVQSGHVLRDPGPAQDPSKWFHRAHETPIDRREAVALNNHNTIEGTSGRYSIWSSPVGQSDFKTMFVSAQNANKRHSLYDSTGGQDSRPSNFITHILIWVGAIAVLLFAVNCTVLLALKKRRRTRTSHEAQADANQHQYSGLQDGKTKRTGVGRVDLYNVEDNECTVKANGSAELSNMTAGSPVIPCSQFGYLPSYSDVHSSHRMMTMDSSSAQQVDTMTGGLSCSSMGSAHSGPVGSLKQSMVMDPVVNPYLMMSEGSSMGASQSNKNSHSVNAPSFHCVPFGPVGYRPGGISNSPSSWNSPASMTPAVYQKTLPNTSPMQTASAASPSPGHIWPASLSPTNSGPCNPGYTSGLGSVGTCEGCSDEGVASGFEMISLSQEVVNITGNNGLHAAYPQLTRGPSGVVGRVATGGTNSTTSGGSANGTRTGLAHRVQMSTFKRSPTSGLGAGSLSGGSSSADASEFRVHRTPESGGLNEVEMGPQLASRGSIPSDVMYLHHLPSNRFQASPTVPPPIRSNLMTESFSGDKSTTEFGMPTSYPEKNSPEFSDAILHESGVRHHPSLRKNHSTMTKENPSSHKAHILSSPPGSDMGRDLSSSEDLEDTPVPMPPALLLNSHSCFGALNNHNRPFVSTNRQKVLRPSSPLESGLNLGSYKRSDSFGMATKIHPNDSLSPFGGNTAFGEFSKDRSAEPNPYPTSGGQTSVGFGMHGEMVGDTLDTSDEVSSGSKSSSARHGDNKYSKLSGQPRSNTKDPSEITYLHSIPPPEL